MLFTIITQQGAYGRPRFTRIIICFVSNLDNSRCNLACGEYNLLPVRPCKIEDADNFFCSFIPVREKVELSLKITGSGQHVCYIRIDQNRTLKFAFRNI